MRRAESCVTAGRFPAFFDRSQVAGEIFGRPGISFSENTRTSRSRDASDIASLVGELTMRLRWDTVGKKPNELLEKFAVPLRRKTLIFFDRGSPPLGTILHSEFDELSLRMDCWIKSGND